MARREFQDPNVLTRESKAGPEWYIRYRVKQLEIVEGRPKLVRREKWESLGSCADMTKRQAERKKNEILRKVNQEVYTVQSQIQFGHLLKQFLEHHVPGLAVPSQVTYRGVIERYVEPAWAETRLCDIGVIEVEQLFAALELNGLSRNTRRNIKGILKAVWGCAQKWGYLDKSMANPARPADIGGGNRQVHECRTPTLEDVARLMDACEGDVPLLIETLYITGMRISEAAGLHVGDLDFEQGTVHVERRLCRGDLGDTKSESGRRKLGLGDVAVKLQAHCAGKAPDATVFLWKGEPIVDNLLLANYVSPIMKQLGIKFPGFGWHTFRRLHLSLMAEKLSVFQLRLQAGHASVATTQRYIADDSSARREASQNLPKVIQIRKKA